MSATIRIRMDSIPAGRAATEVRRKAKRGQTPPFRESSQTSTLVFRFRNRPAIAGQQHLNGLDRLPFAESDPHLRAVLVRVDVLDRRGQPAMQVVEDLG